MPFLGGEIYFVLFFFFVKYNLFALLLRNVTQCNLWRCTSSISHCSHYLKIQSEIWVMPTKLWFAIFKASLIFHVSIYQRQKTVSISCTGSHLQIYFSEHKLNLTTKNYDHRSKICRTPCFETNSPCMFTTLPLNRETNLYTSQIPSNRV